MAQNPKYAYFLNNIEEQENMIKHLTNLTIKHKNYISIFY